MTGHTHALPDGCVWCATAYLNGLRRATRPGASPTPPRVDPSAVFLCSPAFPAFKRERPGARGWRRAGVRPGGNIQFLSIRAGSRCRQRPGRSAAADEAPGASESRRPTSACPGEHPTQADDRRHRPTRPSLAAAYPASSAPHSPCDVLGARRDDACLGPCSAEAGWALGPCDGGYVSALTVSACGTTGVNLGTRRAPTRSVDHPRSSLLPPFLVSLGGVAPAALESPYARGSRAAMGWNITIGTY